MKGKGRKCFRDSGKNNMVGRYGTSERLSCERETSVLGEKLTYVPVLSQIFCLVFTSVLREKCNYSHFTDEATKAQRGEVNCPDSG